MPKITSIEEKINKFGNTVKSRKPVIETIDPASMVWSEPEPFDCIKEMLEFPLNSFPDPIKEAIGIAAHNNHIPIPIAAASAVNSLSVAVQGLYNIQRPGMNPSPINMNNLTIADSGDRKTTSDFIFMGPIMRYIGDSKGVWEEKVRLALFAHRTWEVVVKDLIKKISAATAKGDDTTINILKDRLAKHVKDEPKKLNMPTICVEDFSQEALVSALANNPTVALNSSEGGAIFGGMGFNPESRMKTIATINKAYSGESQVIIRKTTDNINLNGDQRLSVNIMIQKEVLLEVISKNISLFIDSGFLARFNICEPESLQGKRLIEGHTRMPEDALNEFTDKIYHLIEATFTYHSEPENKAMVLSFDEEAIEYWIKCHDNIETRLNTEFQAIRSSASKGAENIARMSALFHIITNYDGNSLDSIPSKIGIDSVVKAQEVEEYYLQSVARITLDHKINTEVSEAEKKLGAMARACLSLKKNFLTTSEVGKYTSLRSDDYEPLLERLANMGWIRVFADSGKGKKVYLHPKVIQTAKANECKVIPITRKKITSKKSVSAKTDDIIAPVKDDALPQVISSTADEVSQAHIAEVSMDKSASDVDFSEVEALRGQILG